ncbi:Uncharacterised protein [Collinsella aerofaciens]|uniref:Uncharacterized protein n=1 Tax=Collinsella aerofaciens TaxID=74426 RepID=A0A5K1JDG7_9ACTN|nr:hypothetical protein [Collinsella aerofaciens]VWM02636.1 Uncharacterised protein [Collinsella aerofaciens]
MSIELPKDAKGREIPLDTECLYTYKGEKQDVLSFTYDRREDIWEIETDMRMVNSIYLYLTPLDSWKRLFEDLDRCIAGDNICLYCSPSGRCSDCANEPRLGVAICPMTRSGT